MIYNFNINDLLNQFVRNAIFLAFVLFTFACSQNKSTSDTESLNALQFEESTYLKRHATNPIDWHAWSDETLKKAQSENKLLVISIGYFSCFWCQVMEEETFLDTLVARVMNEHFISIKVDREERPDIDLIYTEAALQMTGNAGWPLNVIATPDGKPLFAGTYFEKQDWLSIIERASYLYEEQPETIKKDAQRLTERIRQKQNIEADNSSFDLAQLDKLWLPRIDTTYGGINGAEKFPNAPFLLAMMDYIYYYPNTVLHQFLKTTLDRMATGGLFDVVGGGFYRYTTDSRWGIPHFEKILYDNAQLISLYAKAYQKFKDPFYLQIAERTMKFLTDNMCIPNEGFLGSINAVSNHAEGAFYTWQYEELKEAGVSQKFMNAFQIAASGNWEEGKNVLHSNPEFKNDFLVWAENGTLNDLKTIRSQRKKPSRDNKVLSGWNALMINAYVDLFKATGSDKYLNAAKKQSAWLLANFLHESKKILQRSKHQIEMAFLEDQAIMIHALIELYQVDLDEKWLRHAKELTANTLKAFDQTNGLFAYSDERNHLFLEAIPTLDTDLPSGNALMAHNLLRLGEFYFLEHNDWRDWGKLLLEKQKANILKQPTFKGQWIRAALFEENPPYEIAMIGNDFREAQRAFLKVGYRPDWVMMGGLKEGKIPLLKNKAVNGKTMIYVCKNKVCKLPTNDVARAIDLANN